MANVDPIIAKDPRTIALLDRVRRAAASPGPVLVLGEPGTGKRLVARALHAWGPRSSARLVTLSSADGSTAARLAPEIERARGGTVVVDRIDRASTRTRAALVAALDGSPAATIVCTSRADPRRASMSDPLDASLARALSGCILEVPPLRDRRDDVLPLTIHFLDRLAAARGDGPREIGADARRRLLGHDWPGNVRELALVVARSSDREPLVELERVVIGSYAEQEASDSSDDWLSLTLALRHDEADTRRQLD